MVYFHRLIFTNHKNLTEYHNVMVINRRGYKAVKAVGKNYIKNIIVKKKESVHLLMDQVTGRPSAVFVTLTDKYNFTVYYYGPDGRHAQDNPQLLHCSLVD